MEKKHFFASPVIAKKMKEQFGDQVLSVQGKTNQNKTVEEFLKKAEEAHRLAATKSIHFK